MATGGTGMDNVPKLVPQGIPSEEHFGTLNLWQERFDALIDRIRANEVSQEQAQAEFAVLKTAPKGSIRARGSFAWLPYSTEEFMREKQEEIALEDA
jgi:hypothetical protein